MGRVAPVVGAARDLPGGDRGLGRGGILRAGLFAEGAPLPVLLAAGAEIALIGLLSFHVIGLGRRLRRTAMLRRVR
jgi:hypothetical protein